jgi:hypothetical protein
MDHPRPTLKYVPAKALTDTGTKLDGLEVDGCDGEKLGTVDGFIVDIAAARPYHLVLDAGHWFTHKYALLPVGHVMMSADGTRLVAELSKKRVRRFPGFDRSAFEKLTDDDMKRMDDAIAAACCPDEVVVVATWESGVHYRYPEWWQESYYQVPAIDRHR